MKLIIHDLTEEELKELPTDLSDAVCVGDRGTIKPCIGCFGCWKKTTGKCVVPDGYDSMGELIHASDEVIVYSRLTFGGFSGFVKNVFDRCLPYVLPHFELVEGESHHKKRYDETKNFTFRFRGGNITDEEKRTAESYVRAVCRNIRGEVKEISFAGESPRTREHMGDFENRGDGILILNVSMRAEKSNSARLSGALEKKMLTECDTLYLRDFFRDPDSLILKMTDYDRIILAMPLYVDGIPSQAIRLMERIRDTGARTGRSFWLLANMGLYETRQLENMLSQVKLFCESTNNAYCGAVAVGAGELVGGLMDMTDIDSLFLRDISKALEALGKAADTSSAMSDIYTGPRCFPRSLYIAIANSGWKRMARQYGLKEKDLYRQY